MARSFDSESKKEKKTEKFFIFDKILPFFLPAPDSMTGFKTRNQ